MAAKVFNVEEVRISQQDVGGVLNATPGWFVIPAASCSVKESESLIDIDTLSNGVEPAGSFLSGIEDITGNIPVNLKYSILPWLNDVAIGEGTITELATTDWEASTIYAVGNVVNGTAPATDDLVVQSIVGTGTSDATAPDTAALEDGDTIDDNEVTWVVRKNPIRKVVGGIVACQKLFAIEVKISANCGGVEDVFYFRKLDCVVATLGLNFAKDGSMLKGDLSIVGGIAQNNIKADGAVDADYEDFSVITGNSEIDLSDSPYLKQGDIDFKLNDVMSDTVTTMSLTLDNGVDKMDLLSKSASGDNRKIIFSKRRKVSGSLDAYFDTALFGKMDGETTNKAEVIIDMQNGEYMNWLLPNIKFSKDEPEHGAEVAKLSPEYSAEFNSADGSAFQYEVHTTGLAYE